VENSSTTVIAKSLGLALQIRLIGYRVDLTGRRLLPRFWRRAKLAVILFFDIFSFLRFGPKAPRKYELLHIEPHTVTLACRSHHVGVVRNKFWDLKLVDVEDACGGIPKYAKKRAAAGETWESCGELERVISQRMKNGKSADPQEKDFREHWQCRYGALDALIEELKETGRLRTQKQFRPKSHFREKDGIGICIDAYGHALLADGHHRFGLTLGLGIASIPVYLNSVHPGFMKREDWKERLQQLRADPNE
jgi:hypothetical protein